LIVDAAPVLCVAATVENDMFPAVRAAVRRIAMPETVICNVEFVPAAPRKYT
jgi:hypothetical protein